MYKVVERHIKNNDINSALAECFGGIFFLLVMLIGGIKKSGNNQFYTLMGQLCSNSSQIKKDGLIIPENVTKPVSQPVSNPVVNTVSQHVVNTVTQHVSKPVVNTVTRVSQPVVNTVTVKLLCNWTTIT